MYVRYSSIGPRTCSQSTVPLSSHFLPLRHLCQILEEREARDRAAKEERALRLVDGTNGPQDGRKTTRAEAGARGVATGGRGGRGKARRDLARATGAYLECWAGGGRSVSVGRGGVALSSSSKQNAGRECALIMVNEFLGLSPSTR